MRVAWALVLPLRTSIARVQVRGKLRWYVDIGVGEGEGGGVRVHGRAGIVRREV